jgi:hypothetical protein
MVGSAVSCVIETEAPVAELPAASSTFAVTVMPGLELSETPLPLLAAARTDVEKVQVNAPDAAAQVELAPP